MENPEPDWRVSFQTSIPPVPDQGNSSFESSFDSVSTGPPLSYYRAARPWNIKSIAATNAPYGAKSSGLAAIFTGNSEANGIHAPFDQAEVGDELVFNQLDPGKE